MRDYDRLKMKLSSNRTIYLSNWVFNSMSPIFSMSYGNWTDFLKKLFYLQPIQSKSFCRSLTPLHY